MINKISGVSTEVWGPCAWKFLHAITFRYAETAPTIDERTAMYNLLSSLQLVLPCTKCRKHFGDYLSDATTGIANPDSQHLSSRAAVSAWMVGLHNDVNRRLQKPVIPFDNVKQDYAGDYVCPPDVPLSTNQWVSITTTLCIVVFVLLLFLLYFQIHHKEERQALSIAMSHLRGASLVKDSLDF